ncbi:hypothetical protein R69619_02383 [Paraburkholderia nemoris]|uniref:DUF3613 domain-containing protein n=1 Tax=Paraburkholderia nemoris TaxID=2793076 RepID=UPI00190DC408|nr:DUF3613 domain-containing protein [Paraburkholderia nemoris]MBK3737872.1 DUF3613 domain-containing protein [Paraburkholderia aspalathi]CAE6738948.1 hypothetical protein R69619_02383 [Paraburkholderia nemoris]
MKDRTTKRSWVGSLLCFAVAIGVAAPVVAQTSEAAQPAEATQAPVRASEVGHSTRAWLDLQSSNTQAAPALPMLGAEAGLAYRRYMESFKSKIPDLYGSALGTGSGGGNGGAMGAIGGPGPGGSN